MTTPPNGQNAHIKPQLSISPEEYMKDRVVYKMNRYSEKSEQQKFWYQLTSVIAIVGFALVPVLINLGVAAIWPTIVSLVVTILVSMEKLFHFREHWRNYDAMSAFLRSEQLQFQTLTGAYKDTVEKPKEALDAFQLFLKNIEEGIKEERNDTIEMRTKETN